MKGADGAAGAAGLSTYDAIPSGKTVSGVETYDLHATATGNDFA